MVSTLSSMAFFELQATALFPSSKLSELILPLSPQILSEDALMIPCYGS